LCHVGCGKTKYFSFFSAPYHFKFTQGLFKQHVSTIKRTGTDQSKKALSEVQLFFIILQLLSCFFLFQKFLLFFLCVHSFTLVTAASAYSLNHLKLQQQHARGM